MNELTPARFQEPALVSERQADQQSDQGYETTILTAGRQSIERAITMLRLVAGQLNDNFVSACRLIFACRGRIVVAGIGKSGHVGNKIASTLASTGTPAVFVHPNEASHGDLGMITKDDIVLILSNSGASRELNDLIAYLKRFAIKMIAITADSGSLLGENADLILQLPP
ncbi:MAG: SIS domain-containing protein, partial [Pseudomonadota bacterium]